jgi:DHA1 family bicyclomycin/chloramphenicol resistance-like MFS transporter
MREREFAVLMASMTSLIALSIDVMLPALPVMGESLGVLNSNHTQLILSFLFFGMAVGLLFFGPLSDSMGRKPPVYIGLSLFMLGCGLALWASDLTEMLVGRFLQGFGLGAPRIVSIALVRDQYQGKHMARIMSFIMAVFILVPTIAPALGQGILAFFEWPVIFWFLLGVSFLLWIWFGKRQVETLVPSKRIPFSVGTILRGIKEVCGHRISLGYTLANGIVFGGFLGYLNLSQPILQDLYGLDSQFALYFGALALVVGLGSYCNGRWVMQYGMKSLSFWSVGIVGTGSCLFLLVVYFMDGIPTLWMFMAYLSLILFWFGILFGNMTALAMEPLGHIAGLGAAVVGSLSTAISVPLSIYIGQQYQGTVSPVVWGFFVCSLATLAVMYWTERGEAV